MATKKKATASKASPKKTQSGKTSKAPSPKAKTAKPAAKKSPTKAPAKAPKTASSAGDKKATKKAAASSAKKAPAKTGSSASSKSTSASKSPAKSAPKSKSPVKPGPAAEKVGQAAPSAAKAAGVGTKPKPTKKPAQAPPASIRRALEELDDDLDDDLTHVEPPEDSSRDKSDGPLRAYEPPKAPPKPLSPQAAAIIAADAPLPLVQEQGALMLGTSATSAVQAARLLHELVEHKPELVVSLAEKFARGLTSKHKRVVQTSADALPAIARIAPAKVARHLELLKNSYEPAILDGRDGLVRTFAALCTASVAYQKRLEPSLTTALERADGKTLLRWSRIVLPALKGEPHARARGVVEARLYRIPRAIAQQIADFLKIKLRVRY
ncbi:MAG: hypothetical protein R3B40_13770 [Polyangiales bacterium]